MFSVWFSRNNSYSRFFLGFISICILAVCIANVSPEFEKFSYTDSNNASIIITSLGNELCDIVSDGRTDFSEIKSIVSKKLTTEKGSRLVQLIYAVVSDLLISFGACVLFILHFNRYLATNRHFIITYIHNLDGMKP